MLMATIAKQIRQVSRLPEMIVEEFGGREYAYVPLGEHVVAARGVCGGRPTIKYTRLDARHIIGMLRAGEAPEQIAHNHGISVAAITEASELAEVYDYELSHA
jgi:uncharacterized protein (DUF433 family)